MRKFLVFLLVIFNCILSVCCLIGLYMIGMILLKVVETQQEETIEKMVEEGGVKDIETPQPFGKPDEDN